MDLSAVSALERYGVLGVVAGLLIAAFIWYQRTQDKFRDEERVSNTTLRGDLATLREESEKNREEIKALRDEIKALRNEISAAESAADEWKNRYEAAVRENHHPRHEEGVTP